MVGPHSIEDPLSSPWQRECHTCRRVSARPRPLAALPSALQQGLSARPRPPVVASALQQGMAPCGLRLLLPSDSWFHKFICHLLILFWEMFFKQRSLPIFLWCSLFFFDLKDYVLDRSALSVICVRILSHLCDLTA